jgi:undecaprenyl-diphosphatase
MEYLETILLGLIQGIAEFLPISSSGHLVIGAALFESFTGRSTDPEANLQLNIALHFGTLLSIVVVYWQDLLQLIHKPQLMLAIVVATAPLGLVAVLKDYYAAANTPLVAGFCLCITAALLFLTPRFDKGERLLDAIHWRDALLIGLFQVVAPLPGISRSGVTIVAGLLSGLKRDAAAKFSFLIAIPAILGASVFELKDLLEEGPTVSSGFGPVVAGMVVAFVVGIFALRGLIQVVNAGRLPYFGWYCLSVAIAVLIWQLAG